MTMKKFLAWLIPIIILAIAIAIVVLLIISKPSIKTSVVAEPTQNVTVVVVEKKHYAPYLELLGIVESQATSTLTSTVSGFVKKVDVLPGSIVKKSQLLIELDDSDTQLLYQQREANVENLQAKIAQEQTQYKSNQKSIAHEQYVVKLAQAELTRHEQLHNRGYSPATKVDELRRIVSEQTLLLQQRQLSLEQFEHRIEELNAELKDAQAKFEQAKLDLSRLLIRAPFNGVVTEKMVSVGERVEPGSQLITLYDKDAVEIRAQLPEQDEQVIKKALASKETLTASVNGDKQTDLSLNRITGNVLTGQISRAAYFRATGDHKLIPGESVVVRLFLPKINAYAVPASSVYRLETVYKVVQQRLQAATVKQLGQWLNAQQARWLLIDSSELKNGDKVLVTTLPNAYQGLKVRITDDIPSA